MKEENKVFFGEHGITSTSASYLKNLASEQAKSIIAKYEGLQLFTTHATVPGSTPMIVSSGADIEVLSGMKADLSKVALLHSFCAWLGEAIKAKDSERSYWLEYGIEDYYNEVVGTKYRPLNKVSDEEIVGYPRPTLEDILGKLTVKERETYISSDIRASTYGKMVHPGGQLHDARKEMLYKNSHPAKYEGTGQDLTVFSYFLTVKIEEVEDLFNEIQNLQRTNNQVANSLRARVKEEYQKAVSDYDLKVAQMRRDLEANLSDMQRQYSSYISKKLEETRNLKIVIPDNLQDIYQEINSLGKSTGAQS